MKARRTPRKEKASAIGLTQAKSGRRRYVQHSYSLGDERNFRWDRALETAAVIEDEELSRKISLQK